MEIFFVVFGWLFGAALALIILAGITFLFGLIWIRICYVLVWPAVLIRSWAKKTGLLRPRENAEQA